MEAIYCKVLIFFIRSPRYFTCINYNIIHPFRDFHPFYGKRKRTFIFRWKLRELLWPEGMSYSQWQNIRRSFLCKSKGSGSGGRRSSNQKNKRRRNAKKRLRALRKAQKEERKLRKEKKTERTLMKQKNPKIKKALLHPQGCASSIATDQNKLKIISKECLKKEKTESVRIELITMLKLFMERKKIATNINEIIPEHRNAELITYTPVSIILSALCIFILRMQSGNKYSDKSTDKDGKYSQRNISIFINAPEDRTPVIKTIEKFLKKIQVEQINELMIKFVRDLIKCKFFSQHPEIKFKDYFLIAADCVHSHTYDSKAHHIDKKGQNDCPYCLKRVYNKDTPKEKIKWIHNTLVYTFVFLHHLKIPFYTYPIHAKQIKSQETASDQDHKQEVELVALKATLPLIRGFFPRMKICLLLDGLYANRPTIQLAEQWHFKYAIVRKEACLTSLAKDCNGLALLPDHQKIIQKKQKQKTKNGQ